ncbi:hypothetical protein NUU61_008852 [Penicillium alfredii]|uniref:Cyclin n=1 Tax=Penicillium alfredii TaxID=1506179 RepID=A0A9W9ELX2_9EURO|nr:uncharacterized protein NUU61_008852 [Penicillium alfredii]KAJ5084273.1 hypothetical protein NUU61_008852 [Penicillium alfredii]
MVAVMTQIEGSLPGARSPHAPLKLGSPDRETDQTGVSSLFKEAAEVFDITPEIALQMLCSNVENLNAQFANLDESSSHSSTPVGSEVQPEGGLSINPVGLHCRDPDDSGQTREDAFQLALLSRKFLSKKVPPIPLKDYLQRLHRYCPMSTGVFLATSLYITKMVLVEKVLHVTPKNMHRLVLSGLLVATKALEDISYPHSRIAKVGGVSELELSKLEISFCFLANFELRVDVQMLADEAKLQSRADSAPENQSH